MHLGTRPRAWSPACAAALPASVRPVTRDGLGGFGWEAGAQTGRVPFSDAHWPRLPISSSLCDVKANLKRCPGVAGQSGGAGGDVRGTQEGLGRKLWRQIEAGHVRGLMQCGWTRHFL